MTYTGYGSREALISQWRWFAASTCAADHGLCLAGQGVTIQLTGSASTSASGVTDVASLGVYVDRRNAPPPTNTTYGGGFDGGPVTLPKGSTPGNNLRLRTLIDNSLFEVSDTRTL